MVNIFKTKYYSIKNVFPNLRCGKEKYKVMKLMRQKAKTIQSITRLINRFDGIQISARGGDRNQWPKRYKTVNVGI